MLRQRSLLLLMTLSASTTLTAQTPAVIAPGENLLADGLPPIPAALAGDVRRYTESRSAGLADWHPQRRELLISTRFGNTNQLHVVQAPGGARSQITFFDEPIGGTSAATSSTSCTGWTWRTARSHF